MVRLKMVRQVVSVTLILLLRPEAGLGQTASDFDQLIDTAVSLSERALYDAKFEDALRFVDVSYFEQFESFREGHKIQLTVQIHRVEGFRNLLFQLSSDRERQLQDLYALTAAAGSLDRKDVAAEYYLSMSSALRAAGRSDSSLVFEERSLELFHEAKDHKRVAEIRAGQISRRHIAFLNAGETEKILSLIPEYMEEISFSSNHSKYALAYNTRHLAQIHRRQTGNLVESLKLFQQSLELRQEIGFKPLIPASYSSIGDVFLAMNDHENAIEAYKVSCELAEEIGFVRYQIYPNIQIGDIYFEQDNRPQARKHYQKALDYATKNNNQNEMDRASEKIESLD